MGPNRGDSEALTDALFKHLDVNKDGKLSKEELAAAPERLRKLDTDDDEMISVAELVPNLFGNGEKVLPWPYPAVTPVRQALPDNAPFFRVDPGVPGDKLGRRLLSQYDKDKNGKLSAKEIGLDAADFAALDKNKDGQLDLAELAAFAASDARPGADVSARQGAQGQGAGRPSEAARAGCAVGAGRRTPPAGDAVQPRRSAAGLGRRGRARRAGGL